MARTDRIFRAKSEMAVPDRGDGVPGVIHRDDLVREGHPLLKDREAMFELFEPVVTYDTVDRSAPVEQATAAPGERRKR